MKWIATAAVALLFWTSCSNAPEAAETPVLSPQEQIDKDIDKFKELCSEGDLVTHLNDDFVSDVIRKMSEKDKSYSHSGIIVIRDGKKMVCNIYPTLKPNSGNDTIQYQALYSFLNPQYNLTAGLFRYDLSETEKKNFLNELANYKNKNIHFDEAYDYSTDDKLYCSELIGKSLITATNGRYSFRKIRLTKELAGLFKIYYSKKYNWTEEHILSVDYIPIDNLYNIPQCKEIMRVKLKYMPPNSPN